MGIVADRSERQQIVAHEAGYQGIIVPGMLLRRWHRWFYLQPGHVLPLHCLMQGLIDCLARKRLSVGSL